ncbi:hypothetical protein DV515_00009557 [Chloebia gouldiae]|uniref:Uncharacterized protein n=1 Tax=Chloebia gouldiae TaxID=44316 RepID=A0A3L8SBT7_CHLGU|nr:hypothetical protein DV515_00009557 [Chloebia gouldiae]
MPIIYFPFSPALGRFSAVKIPWKVQLAGNSSLPAGRRESSHGSRTGNYELSHPRLWLGPFGSDTFCLRSVRGEMAFSDLISKASQGGGISLAPQIQAWGFKKPLEEERALAEKVLQF